MNKENSIRSCVHLNFAIQTHYMSLNMQRNFLQSDDIPKLSDKDQNKL